MYGYTSSIGQKYKKNACYIITWTRVEPLYFKVIAVGDNYHIRISSMNSNPYRVDGNIIVKAAGDGDIDEINCKFANKFI